MNSSGSILSIFLLSAYALLLLHDFIPHSHHNHESPVHDISQVHNKSEHHHHHHDHHHSGNHPREKEQDKNTEEPSDHSSDDASSTDTHSHSSFAKHQHKLVYRIATKDKLVPPAAVLSRSEIQRTPPKQSLDDNFSPIKFIDQPSRQIQISSHGLRAPPVLA